MMRTAQPVCTNSRTANVHRLAADRFDDREHDVPAVQDRDRQHVQDGEVHVQNDAEPERELPAAFALEEEVIDPPDPDRPAQVLELHVRFRRGDGADRVDRARDAVVNLLDRIRMRDRHAAGAVPANPDARRLLPLPLSSIAGVSCGSSSCFTAHHLQGEWFLGMLLDVVSQRVRVEDRDAIETADDVAMLQSCGRRGRVRLHFIDDRRERGQDQHLPNALAPPTAASRTGMVRRLSQAPRRCVRP